MASRGRRERRKQLTRRELLDAGRRLFGDKGLYESRIEDLTRRAGIAKGTIYGYFANKDRLMEAVVASGLRDLLSHVRAGAQRGRTRTEVMARVAEAHLSFFEQNPDLLRILHQVRGLLMFNRPEGRRLRPLLVEYLAGLGPLLAVRERGARTRPRADLERATLLFGAASGIASTRVSRGAAVRDASASRATVRGLVALLVTFEGAGRK
jgi:AcrR family transcriptional regulator